MDTNFTRNTVYIHYDILELMHKTDTPNDVPTRVIILTINSHHNIVIIIIMLLVLQ